MSASHVQTILGTVPSHMNQAWYLKQSALPVSSITSINIGIYVHSILYKILHNRLYQVKVDVDISYSKRCEELL